MTARHAWRWSGRGRSPRAVRGESSVIPHPRQPAGGPYNLLAAAAGR
jgi:hypothetical protein